MAESEPRRDGDVAAPTRKAAPAGRRRLVRIHRWLGLAAAAFWLVQAVTGVLIVFHWDLDDALLRGAHRPTDLAAIERRLTLLAPAGGDRRVVSVWTSAGTADRYDVTIATAAGTDLAAVRIAGDGTVLRTRAAGDDGVLDTLVSIHQTLLAGAIGSWMVGISGLLLLSNLALGLATAWPRRGWWRRAVTPVTAGPKAARLYSWHRAAGLWAVIPALVTIAAGTMLVFEDGTASLIGATPVAVTPRPAADRPILPFSAAVRAAERAIPGSRLTAVSMPTAADATYRIRLLAPGEIRRAYGTSVVFVDAVDGSVRGLFPASAAPWPRVFMDALYAVHTGEIAGIVGRLLILALGAWLASMTVIGILLWWRRRPRSRPAWARARDRPAAAPLSPSISLGEER